MRGTSSHSVVGGRRVTGVVSTVLVALCVAVFAASCAVPPSAPRDRVPLRWAQLRDPDVADIEYGEDPAAIGDLYLPVGGGNRGVIVVVHGGAFTGGRRGDSLEYSGVIMAQTARGFSVFNVDYRLTSGGTNVFPAAVDDVSAAVRWVREEGPALGVNTDTVIVAGHSVGGTIAALVALGWNSDPTGPLGRTERVDGYISFAGVMDFGPAATISAQYGDVWLGKRSSDPRWRAAASPVSHMDPADPPGYLAHGDRDNIVEWAQLERMVDALVASGSPATKLHLDRVRIGDPACRWHVPQCGLNATQLDRWIDRVVKGEF